jgi:hypothetical protein
VCDYDSLPDVCYEKTIAQVISEHEEMSNFISSHNLKELQTQLEKYSDLLDDLISIRRNYSGKGHNWQTFQLNRPQILEEIFQIICKHAGFV